MTFKNTKFSESEIQRSFEKLANKKSLSKSVVELNLTASDNLMQDVIKLCAGLRSRGFNKYAEELESNLISYKKASSLYETSKETGEDLINQAHPKGSHKLKGVMGDAIVETILDRHLKMLEVVDKKPTGKLASENILNLVKEAVFEKKSESLLSEHDSKLDAAQLKGNLNTLLSRAHAVVKNISNILDSYRSFGTMSVYDEASSNPTHETISKAISQLTLIYVNSQNPVFNWGVDSDKKIKVKSLLELSIKTYQYCLELTDKISELSSSTTYDNDQTLINPDGTLQSGVAKVDLSSFKLKTLMSKFNKAEVDLKSLKGTIPPDFDQDSKNKANKWFTFISAKITVCKNKINEAVDSSKKEEAFNFCSKELEYISGKMKELEDFLKD